MFQVDAFAAELFKGNPAAVCPLDSWLPDAVMQSIAAENNLSETAFCVREGAHYRLRWFTPAVEVDLCGHATLATAHVLLRELGSENQGSVEFETRSGRLVVRRAGDDLLMDFPAYPPEPCAEPDGMSAALGVEPESVLAAWSYVAVLREEEQLAALAPDIEGIKALDRDGLIVTAPGREVDFVSRCFFPGAGIPEDPVTGSAHCIMAPYWAQRLGRNELSARQISARGGEVGCRIVGDRVELAGQARTYLRGEIEVPPNP